MPRSWDGFYLDGQSATRHPVTIQAMQSGLQITRAGEPTIIWPYAQIRQTQGLYEGEQVRLERGHGGHEAIIVPDQSFGTELRALLPHATGHIHDPSRRGNRVRWTFVAGLGAIGLGAALYLWGIPALAWAVTPWVPISWEKTLGQTVMTRMDLEDRRCKNPLLNEAMQVMLDRLEAAARANPYQIKLMVTNNPFANAYAVPGGYVVMFHGLIKVSQRPEQVAGVLAHELQHIYQRHSMRMIIEHTSGSLLLGALVGDFSSAMAIGLEAAHTIGLLRYSRGHEREADLKGMELMARAGIDPRGMVEFFEILSREGPQLPAFIDYVNSHPSSQARIDYLKKLAGTLAVDAEPLMKESDWEDLKQLCHSSAGADGKHKSNQAPKKQVD